MDMDKTEIAYTKSLGMTEVTNVGNRKELNYIGPCLYLVLTDELWDVDCECFGESSPYL